MISISQVEVNLVRAYAAHVRELYSDVDEDEGQQLLLSVLSAHEKDLQRKIDGHFGSLDYLAYELKPAVRSAGELMDRIWASESQSMIGWHYGVEAINQVQLLYGMISETVLELSWSILEIESQHPEWKWLFDKERADYARIHEQWRRNDEAESLA